MYNCIYNFNHFSRGLKFRGLSFRGLKFRGLSFRDTRDYCSKSIDISSCIRKHPGNKGIYYINKKTLIRFAFQLSIQKVIRILAVRVR